MSNYHECVILNLINRSKCGRVCCSILISLPCENKNEETEYISSTLTHYRQCSNALINTINNYRRQATFAKNR